MQAAVNRYIRERNITCDFLFWLCKNRPAIYGQLIEPQLFMAILSVLEKDQFSEIKKGTKLYELVLGDKPLIAAILKDAPVADVRDITRAILLSPVFEELDKRSLLAAIIKLYPEVQAMVVGTDKTAAPEAKIIVSWPSLKRREAELEDLDTQPDSAKQQGHRHRPRLRRSAREPRIQVGQGNADHPRPPQGRARTRCSRAPRRPISPTPIPRRLRSAPRSRSRTPSRGETLVYTILGAWDSDLSKGIISYQTAVARALLNHTVGERIELSTDEGGHPPRGDREDRAAPGRPVRSRLTAPTLRHNPLDVL